MTIPPSWWTTARQIHYRKARNAEMPHRAAEDYASTVVVRALEALADGRPRTFPVEAAFLAWVNRLADDGRLLWHAQADERSPVSVPESSRTHKLKPAAERAKRNADRQAVSLDAMSTTPEGEEVRMIDKLGERLADGTYTVIGRQPPPSDHKWKTWPREPDDPHGERNEALAAAGARLCGQPLKDGRGGCGKVHAKGEKCPRKEALKNAKNATAA